jgi:hypothetical protein
MSNINKSKANGTNNTNSQKSQSQILSGKDNSTVVEERKKRLSKMIEVVASKARFKISSKDGTKVITVDAESPEIRPVEIVKSKKGGTFELPKGVVFQVWNSVGAPQEWRLVPTHAEKLLAALEQANARYVVVAVKRDRDDMATSYEFTVMGSSDDRPEGTVSTEEDKEENNEEDDNN